MIDSIVAGVISSAVTMWATMAYMGERAVFQQIIVNYRGAMTNALADRSIERAQAIVDHTIEQMQSLYSLTSWKELASDIDKVHYSLHIAICNRSNLDLDIHSARQIKKAITSVLTVLYLAHPSWLQYVWMDSKDWRIAQVTRIRQLYNAIYAWC